MKEVNVNYRKHVLVCVNERDGSCCSKVGGNEIHRKLKEYVFNNGLASSVWVTKARCLGFCNDVGATIVIYPDRKWFTEVKEEDLDGIIEEIEK